jgi:hypothetical protein
MIEDTELAWAAGFFDGEGSVSRMYPSRNKRNKKGEQYPSGEKGYMQIQVAQREDNAEVLHRFAAAVGVGSVRGPYGPYKGASINAKPYYLFGVYTKTAEAVLDAIWPWLSSRKRADALAAGYPEKSK